ncbi:Lrp/AsnC family transcriptional regulator [Halodesulfurarchaeum formicicum]|uniref:AsnC family transcriptional regulator n=1 Tax=Halodesulfurarchaeum formicicum TaxID=1873524 RepID=A0A1J1AAK9_9EURY|nr:Lrp/AsnC family transcriptional regulator [Halodesulfurarchaeum formicicum]APE94811.1 AsnC family transcriptional regulator [Halodesulfurarchaeum formicicum]
MTRGIDSIDETILYHLSQEARHTSAPEIAEAVDVSAPTVRNRIRKLESAGIIRGYHADIDYEQVDGRLTYTFVCSTGDHDREEMAQRILDISGVIEVQEYMSGKGDLSVKVVGDDTDDLTQIAQHVSSLGVDIDDEKLVYREYVRPYAPFGPREADPVSPVTGVDGLAGNAAVFELLVQADAAVAGQTLKSAKASGLLSEDVLIVRINRDGESLTPTGETRIETGDFVTLHSRSGLSEATLKAFLGERAPSR